MSGSLSSREDWWLPRIQDMWAGTPGTAVQGLQGGRNREAAHIPAGLGLAPSSAWLWALINSPSFQPVQEPLPSHARGCPWAGHRVLQGSLAGC